MKRALVLGAGGFIGNHLVNKLVELDYYVCGVDVKEPEFSASKASSFIIADLRRPETWQPLFHPPQYRWDYVFQLAADMGGAGYIFSGENDFKLMGNSAIINILCASWCAQGNVGCVFYSSSACIYPAINQVDPENPNCAESSAYPANPDSEYGWEKLFSERLYLAAARNANLKVRIGRFHNIYGPEGVYQGGREKSPAALCRKVAMADNGEEIEVWGDGLQTRSFLYVDECVKAIFRLIESDITEPINIGSEEMVTVNELAQMIIAASGKKLTVKNVPSETLGVRGRNSDNKLIQEKIGWVPNYPLVEGIAKTYEWINQQIHS